MLSSDPVLSNHILQAASEAYLEGLQHLTPQEHVAAVKPLWETLDEAERLKLLTVPLDDLTTYAKEQAARAKAVADAEAAEALRLGHVIVSLEPPVDEVLEEGLARSRERGTWKVWHWAPEDMQCYDSDTFRKFLHEKVLTEEQLSVLPRDDPSAKIPERPAEAAFRQRMVDLITRISEQRVAHEEAMMARQKAGIAASTGRRGAADPQTAFRDIHIDLVTSMLSALEHEHESVYHHCLHPVCAYVCDMLPEDARKSTRTDLHYEDLESLLPDDVTRIYEFLTEKVDALSSKLRAEAKELEAEAGELDDEPIGDVDLFSLVDDGAAIRVNDKWLYHLQSRVLSEDGQPRRAKPEEDPKRLGLVLEWVYGTIVSTAEKARDAARRSLASQPPSPELAVDALVGALNEQTMWEARAKESRELLAQMLASRKEMAELAEKHDMRAVTPPPRGPAAAAAAREGEPAAPADANGDGSAPSPELPDHVYITVLKREALLTAAKLHFLSYEHQAAQRNLRSLTAQLRQGEPQFERLKRELDEVKAAPSRSLEGTYRTTAEMERARKQLADAAIEEQIHVQAALRQTGTRLQKIVETRGEVEMALRSRDAEMGQLSNWRAKVLNLVKAYEAAMAAAAPLQHATAAGEVDEEGGEVDEAQRALIAAVKSATRQEEELQRLRSQFRTDVRHQLYSSEDDLVIFSNIKRQLKDVEQRLETGRVALQHLEAFVLNVACDDPGIVISSHLILPFLQQRLDTKALEFAAQRAAAALDEVMQMEVRYNKLTKFSGLWKGQECEQLCSGVCGASLPLISGLIFTVLRLLQLEDADRQRQEKEKKAKAKLKAKEKLRMEKEKERADREAREQAAKAQAEEEARAAAAREEEEKRRRAQEVEELRRKEEELMERRRAELLAQEGSYWQKRAQQEELIAAQIEIEQELMRQALENGDLAAGGEGEFESAGARAAGRRSKGAKDKDKERQPARERQPRDAKGAGKERAERGEKVAPRKIKSDTKPATAEGPAAVAVVNGISRESSPPLPEAATSPLAPMSPDRPESGVPALPSTPQNASGQPSATLQAEPPLPVAPVAPQGGPPVAGSFPASAGALPPVLPVPVAGPQPPHALPPTVIPIPVGVPLPSGMVAPLPLVTQMPLPPGAIRPPPPPPHVAQPPIVPGQHSRSASADSGSPTRPMPGPQGVPHFPPGSFPPGMGPPMPPHMVYMPPVAPGGAPPQASVRLHTHFPMLCPQVNYTGVVSVPSAYLNALPVADG